MEDIAERTRSKRSDRRKSLKDDLLHSQAEGDFDRLGAVDNKSMTGDMSTQIEPRKKALRLNPKTTLTGRTVLLALMFAVGAAGAAAQGSASPAAANTDEPAANAAPDSAPADGAAKSRSHRPPHRSPTQVIDANVRRLAQGLNLDQEQQVKLREILVDQYAQLMKLRTESAPGTDRAGAIRASVDRTRERIRQMLNDEQKKQYSTEVPREVTAATRADLEHWLDVRDAQRREDTEESK